MQSCSRLVIWLKPTKLPGVSQPARNVQVEPMYGAPTIELVLAQRPL
jgi:hypothetical protein